MKICRRCAITSILLISGLILGFRPHQDAPAVGGGKENKVVFFDSIAGKADRVAYVEMGGAMLEIPKKYLWFEPTQADGSATVLNLMLRWPDMNPGDAFAPDQRMNVNVVLKIPGEKPAAPAKTEYRLACAGKTAECRSVMTLEGLQVEYGFSRQELLSRHVQLRRKLEERLRSFVIAPQLAAAGESP